ncbi:hypothetical protein DW1_2941 [Proteiniborus sp. DW1]|uniref:DUF5711 family protein n=1 Tax=Proteiniborus sp. DW1 TaxID=1889883 RepID=UPI00092E173B|nr:DUF5711 family protein [Proteiniborus sp. DW1]SCG84496.1 hypothetical protein DW1_2941 [Proteiniborus sp. DW1]
MIAKEEKRKSNKLVWVIILFLIIGLMFLGKPFKGRIQDLFKQTEKSLELVQAINIPWNKEGHTRSYERAIINYDGKSISSYDIAGDKLWSKSIDFDEPLVYLGESRIFIGDKSKGQIVALNIDGEEGWTYKARQSIDKFAEKNDLLIIYTKAGEQIDQINVLDKKGKLLANTIIDKGRLLSSNISPNHDKFVLVTMDFSGSKIQSSILLYTIEGKLLWKKDYTDLIILDADFMNDDAILGISDRKIISLNMESELLWSRDIKGRLKDLKLAPKQKEIYILYGEKRDCLEVLEVNGKTKSKLELDYYYNNIYTDKSNIYLTGENRLTGIRGNEAFLEYICDNKIENLGFQKDSFLLFTKEGLIIGKLSNRKQ